MNWDLREFFASEAECDAFCATLGKDCSDFKASFENKLSNLDPADFSFAMQKYENLSQKIAKVETWAYLNFAQNTARGALLAKYEKTCSRLSENLLFFMIEFGGLDDEKQREFMTASPKFEYYLSLVAKEHKHKLTLPEERVLLLSSNTGAEAFSRLFDETLARFKFEYRGELLSEEELLAKLSDSNREARKDAALALSSGLEKNAHLLTFIYNIIRADLKNDCELRKFENPEDFRHLDNQISKKSVDALVCACEASFDLPHRFYRRKREILGFERLYDYDRYAPLGFEGEFEFETAKKITLEAFGAFNPEFERIAKHGLEHGWCDPLPAEGKESGAFSHSAVSDVHPFVLLNFTGRRRDVYTLAHEFGHAIHQFLAYRAGFLNSQTPLTTAETASVFCEMLVFEQLKNAATNPEEKRAILAAKIEDIFATLYRQIGFTTFERAVHAREGELSTDELNQIWMKESQKMFGDALTLNDYYTLWWSYIPHFIHTPFYCYAYAYAQLLVLALYGLYKSGECENFVEIYTEFLASGGSKSPREMVAKFGFDIESEEFWQIGLSEVKRLVNEFITL